MGVRDRKRSCNERACSERKFCLPAVTRKLDRAGSWERDVEERTASGIRMRMRMTMRKTDQDE
jgi:hypothetical protein